MKHGQGSVTVLADGRFWARMPDRKRTSLGTYATRTEAEQALGAAVTLSRAKRLDGEAFAAFGRRVLDLREEDGIRGMRQERQRFRTHLEASAIASRPVEDIRPIDIADLVRAVARKVAVATTRRVLSLASCIFDEAVMRGIRPDNPCKGVRVRKDASQTEEVWDYLRPDEQDALVTCPKVPEWGRLLCAFAIGAGLRQGEQWNLELRDLHVEGNDPHVVVRFGSQGKRPKSGKVRRVPLFGLALEAAKRWLEVLPGYAPKNPHGLAFPLPSGARRPVGAPSRSVRRGTQVQKVECLPEWLAAAGVSRQIRWHDLRHTCASSLVSGWWGRRWTLEEVKEMLGHSSITVTQIYAHLGDTALKDAARKTVGPVGFEPTTRRLKVGSSTPELRAHVTGYEVVSPSEGASEMLSLLATLPRNSADEPYGLKGRGLPEELQDLAGTHNRDVTELLARLAEMLKRR